MFFFLLDKNKAKELLSSPLLYNIIRSLFVAIAEFSLVQCVVQFFSRIDLFSNYVIIVKVMKVKLNTIFTKFNPYHVAWNADITNNIIIIIEYNNCTGACSDD